MNLATPKKDDDRYIRDFFVFMKAFSNFIYKNPYSLKPSSQMHEAKEEAQCSGIT